jgi:hypothetical protein
LGGIPEIGVHLFPMKREREKRKRKRTGSET